MRLHLAEMLDADIEDLYDDGFEGSHNEHDIFTKVFFGSDTGSTSKRCIVIGVINFECEHRKNPVLRGRLFTIVLAVAFVHGSCSVTDLLMLRASEHAEFGLRN